MAVMILVCLEVILASYTYWESNGSDSISFPTPVRLLYPPSERSEWRGYTVMLSVLLSFCAQSINRLRHHRCTASVNLFARYCFNRNIFDSCVKSWEYFCSDNISLETSFSWLSDDVFRFKIEMGVVKKCTKMSTPFQMNFSAQKYASHTTSVVIDDVIIISRRLLCKYIIREVLM